MLRFDRDVNQFLTLTEQFAVGIGSFGLMRNDRDDGSKFPDPDLPDVEIGYYGIAVSFHCATNFARQIRLSRRAIEKYSARVAQEAVGPRENNAAADQTDHWVEPRPAEEFAGSQRNDREKRRKRIGQDVQIRRAQIQVMIMAVRMTSVSMVIM